MTYYIIAAFIIIFCIFTLMFMRHLKRRVKYSSSTNEDLSYMPYAEKYILTKNEYAFYRELKKITDKKNQLICPKVRLADLFDVTDRREFVKYFGKINRKHLDFLICDSKLKPLYAIELDDKSHEREDRQVSDRFKDALFDQSSLPLIHIPAAMNYEIKTIKNYLPY